jgi:hypothetical protein
MWHMNRILLTNIHTYKFHNPHKIFPSSFSLLLFPTLGKQDATFVQNLTTKRQ